MPHTHCAISSDTDFVWCDQDGVDNDQVVFMVTEQATPLTRWLEDNRPSGAAHKDKAFVSACAWGLYR